MIGCRDGPPVTRFFDGTKRIEADGNVVFCPAAADVFRRALGYDCERLPPGETEERAQELIARFREYAGRYGVNLDREMRRET